MEAMGVEWSNMFTGSTTDDPIVFSYGKQVLKKRKDNANVGIGSSYYFFNKDRIIFVKVMGMIDYFEPYEERSGLFDCFVLPKGAAEFLRLIQPKYPKLIEHILFDQEEFFG